MGIEKVGVVGFGAMGSGIAQVCAVAGFHVRVRDVEQRFLDRGRDRIAESLARIVKAGRLTDEQARAALGRIHGTLALADLADCDLVVEAVVEEIGAKNAVFAELDEVCGPAAIFTSNTSSLTIVEMATATRRADRFAGLHFFNPPMMMRLVEIVQAITTSDATIEVLRSFVSRLGHTGVVSRDTTGFIVNRLLQPYLNSAVRLLEQGVATAEQIDAAMKLGLGHPMGPLELIDHTGVDIIYHIGNIFFEEFRDPALAPPSLLRRMYLAGRLGVKSGRGFYEYDVKGKRKT